jgi:hypothetical protein
VDKDELHIWIIQIIADNRKAAVKRGNCVMAVETSLQLHVMPLQIHGNRRKSSLKG